MSWSSTLKITVSYLSINCVPSHINHLNKNTSNLILINLRSVFKATAILQPSSISNVEWALQSLQVRADMKHNPSLIMTIAEWREEKHEVQIVALRMTSDFEVSERKTAALFVAICYCMNLGRKTWITGHRKIIKWHWHRILNHSRYLPLPSSSRFAPMIHLWSVSWYDVKLFFVWVIYKITRP